MKITRNWLREYIETDLDAEALAAHLIQIGFDVEELSPAGDDVVLTIDVPSNRPDALGAIGLARELSARLGVPLRLPEEPLPEQGGDVGQSFRVEVEGPVDCPRYTARLIRNIRVAPSPDWMQARLTAVGLTPVNNVVDATNYVLYECGQPLHAFDASRLNGDRVVVRRGRPGEKLEAINGKTCPASADVLVIADDAGPVAFAGIMGGKPTEIAESTRDVLLESAQFDPVVIRRGARKLGLESDSSYRFERGVSYEGVAWASRRAASLIARIAGGRPAPGLLDASPGGSPRPRRVRFRLGACERLLGMPCDPAAVRRVLESIGCRLPDIPRGDDPLEVDLPEHRRDLQRECDLIEEVARHVGYDRIPTTPQIPLVLTDKDRRGYIEARVRERLVAMGYQEVLTLSFSDPALAAAFRLETADPAIVLGKLGTPDRPLRQSVVSSLLDVVRTNERYGTDLPLAFEIANVYGRRPDGGILERPGLGLAARGSFRDLRGHLEALADAVGLPLHVAPDGAPPPTWPTDRTARLDTGDARLGAATELTPADLKPWDLQHGICLAEIDLTPLIKGADLRKTWRDFSRMPDIRRDLAVLVEEGVSWERIAAAVRSVAPPWLERLEAFDVFRGAQIPKGRKSVAFAMSFRREDRTLTRQEVDGAIEAIVRNLGQEVGGTLR
jgi:phenylalanyl-tRNA synthetase beta chain